MFDWIQHFADWLIYSEFGIGAETHLGTALNFFVYDTLKILILLFLIVFFMGIVNAYFPIEKLKDYLHRKKLYGLEYLFASIFGAITPFFSCSSVPFSYLYIIQRIDNGLTFAVNLKPGIKPSVIDEMGSKAVKKELSPCDLDQLKKLEDDFSALLLSSEASDLFIVKKLNDFKWKPILENRFVKTDIINKALPLCNY